MSQIKWVSVYDPIPQALEYRVKHTLGHLDDAPKNTRKLSHRTIVIALVLLLALCGVAYAAYESITADIFGWSHGGNWKDELQNGDIAPMGQSYRLGDVTYTVEEMFTKPRGNFRGCMV